MTKTMLNTLCCLAAMTAMACGGSAADETATAEATATEGAEVAQAEGAATAEAAADAAKTETAPAPAAAPPDMPKYGAFIIHSVKDLAKWQAAFDAHQQTRKDAGAAGHAVLEVVGSPKKVAVWIPMFDQAKAEAFMASDDLKAKMKEAGVVGKPEVRFSATVDEFWPAPVAGQQAPMLASVYSTIKVKDVAAFKAAWDAAKAGWQAAGVVGGAASQDVKDANTLYLYFNHADAKALKAWWTGKDNKKWLKDAGVNGAPKTTWLQEKTMVMYQ